MRREEIAVGLRSWWRQRKNKRWNTCIVDGCYYKADHPDGAFCPDHGWPNTRKERE